MRVSNIMTFDVEEWFDSHRVEPRSIDQLEHRAGAGVDKILSLLSDGNIRATFFVLGRLAQESPDVVRKIHDAGHEVGIHGYSHRPLVWQIPEQFRDDLQRAIAVIKGITGKEVLGYRAPGYTITKQTLWALDIIKECGLQYDSSMYPVSLRLFTLGGLPRSPRWPFQLENNLWEFPLPTLDLLGVHIPVATTAYFRLYPYLITQYALDMYQKKGVPATVNFHSWEFDEDHPRMRLPLIQQIKHYRNLDKSNIYFKKMIKRYAFQCCQDAIEQWQGALGVENSESVRLTD